MTHQHRIGLNLPFIFLVIFSIVYHPSIQELFMKFDHPLKLLLVSPQMFFLLASAYVITTKKVPVQSIGITKKKLRKNILIGVVAGLIPYALFCLANWIVGKMHPAEPSVTSIEWDGWVFFMLFVLAPISEELFFRGVIFHALQESYTLKVSVIASSLLFMATHLPVMIGPFLLGLIASILTYRMKSLVPAVIFHSLSNGLPMFFMYCCSNLQEFQKWIFLKILN